MTSAASFNRRAVLSGASALALASLAGCTRNDADLDVAIIGGGVAGSYAAWRLTRAAPHLRVALFEISERIGGRLRSFAFPKAPHLVGELGGMRFLDVQKHVVGVVKALGLRARPFPVNGSNNRLLLRGKSFTYAQAGRAPKLFSYNIAPGDQSPMSDLYTRSMSRIVPGFATMTPAKWRAMRSTFRYKGRLLKDWSAWALLADAYSHEEGAFMQDMGGYDDVALHESALDAFDFMLLGDDESKPFQTIVGGYQRLPLTLAAEAGKRGVKIAMNTPLVSLHLPGSDGLFRLSVVGADGRQSALAARRVVLALPRRAMELIDDFPALNDPKVRTLVQSAVPISASKSLTLYPRAWWKDQGITGGRSVTDLPARQFYALGAEPERLASEPSNGFGMLMQYCDAETSEYWRELVPPPRASDFGFQRADGASQFAQEINREAALVYGATPPQPIATVFQDWSADPFGGGWHFWEIGVDGAAVAERVMRPVAGEDLFICGEAYTASESGWVEGALERAETMLQRYFGLAAPKWLSH